MSEHYLSPALSGLSPVRISSLSATEMVIRDRIWNAVLDRRFRPGVKLPEAEIGEMFRVSRTVVRKVLLVLEQEGIVTLPLNRGAYIRAPAAAEILEALEAVQLVSGYLVRRLARGGEGSGSRLRRHYEAQRRTDGQGQESVHRLAIEFFVLLAHLGGNRTLWVMQERNLICVSQGLMLFQKAPLARLHHSFQFSIVESIEAGDGDAAVAALTAYLTGLGDSLTLEDPGGDGLHLRSILQIDDAAAIPTHRGRGPAMKKHIAINH